MQRFGSLELDSVVYNFSIAHKIQTFHSNILWYRYIGVTSYIEVTPAGVTIYSMNKLGQIQT